MYDDIINLPHHVSETRKPMPMSDRAAQFSPFAALSGYESVVAEVARLTDERIELDEEEIKLLDRRLRQIADSIEDHPRISVTYFRLDGRKSGGVYVTENCKVKSVDAISRLLVTENGVKIPIDDISSIEGDMFSYFAKRKEGK